eukprot:3942564-Pleurochrysis_carterae.AAC.1
MRLGALGFARARPARRRALPAFPEELYPGAGEGAAWHGGVLRQRQSLVEVDRALHLTRDAHLHGQQLRALLLRLG